MLEALSAFALVRRGKTIGEYLDIDTIRASVAEARKASIMDERIMGPVWTANNPAVRYVRVTVTEGLLVEEVR